MFFCGFVGVSENLKRPNRGGCLFNSRIDEYNDFIKLGQGIDATKSDFFARTISILTQGDTLECATFLINYFQKCLFANAYPEPVLRYCSNSNAASFELNAK